MATRFVPVGFTAFLRSAVSWPSTRRPPLPPYRRSSRRPLRWRRGSP